MGRFYNTSKAEFVDDNIYESPYDLMAKVLQAKEAKIDDAFKRTDLLEGAIDEIKHLNFDEENDRVTNIRNQYSQSIEDITSKIQKNPLDYKKYLPEIKNIKKNMITDKTSGDWYNIEKRHDDYANWLKENEDLKTSNPDLFNKLNRHWYKDVTTKAATDSSARFSGQKGIDKPNLIQGYETHFENIKANATETSNGKYKIGNKWVSEDEVSNIAWNTLLADKNFKGYANQMGNLLGEEGYVDEKGNIMSPYSITKEGQRTLNPRSAFFPDIASIAQTYGFSEESLEEDKYGLQGNKANLDSKLKEQSAKIALNLEALKQMGRKDLLERKYELIGERDRELFKDDLKLQATEGDTEAIELLEEIQLKESIGVIGNPNASLEEDNNLVQNNLKPLSVDGKSSSYYAAPGTREYTALQRRKNSTDYASKQLGNTQVKLNNGLVISPSEYIDWLGDRVPDEELAKEFLQYKGVNQSASFRNSVAENVANKARWTPGWVKEDAAQDWDKIYELGEKYNEYRDTWYEQYSGESTQISLEPLPNDSDYTKNIYAEIKGNPENFHMRDKDGNIVNKSSEKVKRYSNLKDKGNTYVFSANAHNEMGLQVQLDGEEYYLFPNSGNTAEINLVTGLSLEGVDKDSQYFQEMSARYANRLIADLDRTGKNSKNTKSIVTEIKGEELSLELVGDKVFIRDPYASIDSPPASEFESMQDFVTYIYSLD